MRRVLSRGRRYALPSSAARITISSSRCSIRSRSWSRAPFRYRNRGNLAVIGRGSAVADFGWLRLDGFLAWLAWAVVHLYFLIGFEHRLVVFVRWAWAYLTHYRGARLLRRPVALAGSDGQAHMTSQSESSVVTGAVRRD